MKRMGIDFGTKKIGIAITDDAGLMAFPHAVIPNNEAMIQQVVSLIEERDVKELVIGHSLNNEGESNPVHDAAEAFMTEITLLLGIPVHFEPEQYTTKQAEQIQGKNEMVDASAAAIILESFITKKKNNNI